MCGSTKAPVDAESHAPALRGMIGHLYDSHKASGADLPRSRIIAHKTNRVGPRCVIGWDSIRWGTIHGMTRRARNTSQCDDSVGSRPRPAIPRRNNHPADAVDCILERIEHTSDPAIFSDRSGGAGPSRSRSVHAALPNRQSHRTARWRAGRMEGPLRCRKRLRIARAGLDEYHRTSLSWPAIAGHHSNKE